MKHAMRTVLGGATLAALMLASLNAAAQVPAPAPGYPPPAATSAPSYPAPSYPAPTPGYPPPAAAPASGYPTQAAGYPPLRAEPAPAYSSAPSAPLPPDPAEAPTVIRSGKVNHFLGVHLGVGGSFGGDTLVKATYTDGHTEELKAGNGVFVSGGLSLTPIWIADTVGLGLGIEINYQGDSMDANNGSASFDRTGGLFAAHVLVHLWDTSGQRPLGFYLFGAGGVQYVGSAKVSGSGMGSDIAGDLGTATGGMGEIGLDCLWKVFGGRATVRYTKLSYKGGAIDGSSVSVLLGLHWDPWTTSRD